MRTARRAADPPAEPHDTCTVCTDDRACVFHQCVDADELADALRDQVQQRGALGLLDSIEASLATLTNWENNPLQAHLHRLSTKQLEAKLSRLIDDADGWNEDDMVKIAALFLTIRVISDAKEAHAPTPQRR